MVKANISWSAKQISKAVTMGSMTFDNAIQRGHVWDRKRQSKFIDSLIRNYPVPPVYTIKTDIDAPEGCKKGSKVFDCIDGKQRCEAIRAYLNNEFVLTGCEPFNDVELNGKLFTDLDEEIRDAITDYTMTVYFFTDITDDEICDMMSRLNNGKPLTGVENARINAKQLGVISLLANHPLFKENMSEAQIKGYHNEDVVIKTALQMFEKEFELSTKNVKEAYETLAFTEEQVKKLTATFDKAYEAISTVKELAKKAVVRKALKKTNLVGIICLAYEDLVDADKLADFIEVFFDDDSTEMVEQRVKYNEACVNGTNHASNVMTRNCAMYDAIGI